MRTLKLVDFGARFHYLAALETHRPKVLTDLQARTLPVYQQCWQKDPNTTGLHDLAQLSTAVRREAGGEFKAVAEALEKWADKHRFLDQWLKDAGIQSMYGWSTVRTLVNGGTFPTNSRLQSFSLTSVIGFHS